MLYTNLNHIETAADHQKIIGENENVMICYGRMDPLCISVYKALEILEKQYPDVKFYDMEFDNPEAYIIREAPDCIGINGLPYVVYYKQGKIVKAATSLQTINQIKTILDLELVQTNNNF